MSALPKPANDTDRTIVRDVRAAAQAMVTWAELIRTTSNPKDRERFCTQMYEANTRFLTSLNELLSRFERLSTENC